MKKLLSLFLLASLSISCLAATIPETFVFLDYYDSLTSYAGKPGHYFVRDAGNTKTGQHGDPSVLKGWALYVWNERLTASKAGWTKLADQQTLDSSIASTLATNYVNKATFNAAMESVAATYVSNSVYTTTISDFTTRLNSALSRIGTNESNISSLSSQINTLNNSKQTNLVSGVNIKTVNGQSLLGSGNISVGGGGGVSGDYLPLTGGTLSDAVCVTNSDESIKISYGTNIVATLNGSTQTLNFRSDKSGTIAVLDDVTTERAERLTAYTELTNKISVIDSVKQTNLVSGINIKSINSQSLLESGNIDLATPSDITAITNAIANEVSIRSTENVVLSNRVNNLETTKQTNLVSGVNIKTINNQSLLGNGNITIEGGSQTNYYLYSEYDDLRSDAYGNLYYKQVSGEYSTDPDNSFVYYTDVGAAPIDITEKHTESDIDIQITQIGLRYLTSSEQLQSGTTLKLSTRVFIGDGGNSSLFIPDEDNLRHGLPFTIDLSGIPNVYVIGNSTTVIQKLPARINIQFNSSAAILTVDTFTTSIDNTTYGPNISSTEVTYDASGNSFSSEGGSVLVGTGLLQPIQLFVEYPIEGGTYTNEFTSIDSVSYAELKSSDTVVADKPVLFTDNSSWFKLIYTTENGHAEITKTITK